MRRREFAKTNPRKRWECDACYTVYGDYYLNKRGGFCSECGNDTFSEVDRGEPVLEARQWKIKKWVDDDFSLSVNDDEICFNGLWVDDKYWHLYLDGKWIGCLVRRTNQITNYDEHGEELELELKEYERAEYYG